MGGLFLCGLGAMAVAFAIVWAISAKIRNYGFLDVAWSYGLTLLVPFYALLGTGDPVRRWSFAALGMAWSLRLGTHILIRVVRHHPKEDPRYEKLRKQWPGPGKFLLFFEVQALLIATLSWPLLLAAFNSTPGLQPVEWAGLTLGILAILGETLADRQAEQFKSDPANRGKVCQQGFWRYSRHPNYFFEALVWIAFFLFALGSPYGWTTIFCPFLMLWFLLRITGIPLTEEFSVRSKGEAYRDYQRKVSAFIPWFRNDS